MALHAGVADAFGAVAIVPPFVLRAPGKKTKKGKALPPVVEEGEEEIEGVRLLSLVLSCLVS